MTISFRDAHKDDFDFARRVIQETMRDLITAQHGWDQDAQDKYFARHFDPETIFIIHKDDKDVGWLQLKRAETQWQLVHFHLDTPFQNRRIGSKVLGGLLMLAQGANVAVIVSAYRVSPVVRLYQRHGFTIEKDDPKDYKIHMRWQPKPAGEGA